MKRVLIPLLSFVFSFLSAHNLHDESIALTKWNPKNTSTPQDLIKLWYHENMRVFHDRLTTEEDRAYLKNILISYLN